MYEKYDIRVIQYESNAYVVASNGDIDYSGSDEDVTFDW